MQQNALEDGRASSVLKAVTSPPKQRPSTTMGKAGYANGGFWIKGESQRKDTLCPSVFVNY
jgi:hypothetical protein